MGTIPALVGQGWAILAAALACLILVLARLAILAGVLGGLILVLASDATLAAGLASLILMFASSAGGTGIPVGSLACIAIAFLACGAAVAGCLCFIWLEGTIGAS